MADDIVTRLRTAGADGDAIHCWNLCVKAADEIERLRAEAEKLRTVMVAAAEEIDAHWQAHCDADGYGPANLMRRLEAGIPSEYGYTAGAFSKLKAENDALRAAFAAQQAPQAEPVAQIVAFHAGDASGTVKWLPHTGGPLSVGQALYAAPAAPPPKPSEPLSHTDLLQLRGNL